MIHLHKDYHTSWCGLDASYISMTHDEATADCSDCKTACDTTRTENAAAEAELVAQVEADAAATAEAMQIRHEKIAELQDVPDIGDQASG